MVASSKPWDGALLLVGKAREALKMNEILSGYLAYILDPDGTEKLLVTLKMQNLDLFVA